MAPETKETLEWDEIWNPDNYLLTFNENDDLITIESKDDQLDPPTNKYFKLVVHGLTFDRIMDGLQYSSKIEIDDPYGEMGDDGITTGIQIWDQAGESEGIAVGAVRLPGGLSVIEEDEDIDRLVNLIKVLYADRLVV